MAGNCRNGSFIFGKNPGRMSRKIFLRCSAGSLAVHILVLIFFASGLWFAESHKIEFESVQAKLVKLGEERDKKLLPRITQPKPAPKSEKKDPKPEPKKEEKKKASSLDELLSGDVMEKIKRDARAEETKEGAKDGVDDGDVTDPALALKANMYIRQISKLIKQNWNIPSIISADERRNLMAKVYFKITYGGEVYDIKIKSSSGNSVYDGSVIEAVKKTAKLPLPDDKNLKKLVLKEGFECPFTSD